MARQDNPAARRGMRALYAKWHYQLNFALESPENAVRLTKVPVLLIHGQVDTNIPIRHSRKIAATNPKVELWEVPSADHCGAISVSPAELERRVTAWFAQDKMIEVQGTATFKRRSRFYSSRKA